MKKFTFYTIILFSFSCLDNKSYSVIGTIIEIRKESNEFLIHHDEIPGFMMAMTMPFKLADSNDVNHFKVGDSLKFRLIMKNDKAFSSEFQLLGQGTLPESDHNWDDEYSAIDVGEIISDINLLDLDSNIVSLSDSDGKIRLISYIFSRCPVPNMCPAVIVKNQYLSEVFKNETNIEFIIISFDYLYDTPTILNKIYGDLQKSNNNIKILSSTNHINDIYTIAGQSLVSFWGIEENDIGHTLRSILIDSERRLLTTFEGIDWKVEIAERDIKNILKTYQLKN